MSRASLPLETTVRITESSRPSFFAILGRGGLADMVLLESPFSYPVGGTNSGGVWFREYLRGVLRVCSASCMLTLWRLFGFALLSAGNMHSLCSRRQRAQGGCPLLPKSHLAFLFRHAMHAL